MINKLKYPQWYRSKVAGTLITKLIYGHIVYLNISTLGLYCVVKSECSSSFLYRPLPVNTFKLYVDKVERKVTKKFSVIVTRQSADKYKHQI